jgi:hypothetical protein
LAFCSCVAALAAAHKISAEISTVTIRLDNRGTLILAPHI